ncbi:MAG: PTS mannose/fructose/sorbose/N-acetylgalactosamine transporter subunit IIC [Breznakia sp.]
MLEPIQIVIVTILAFIMQMDEMGPQGFGLIYPGIIGPVTGFLLGDLGAGCVVGGTLQLMSLGVAAVGGSSTPRYGWATIIATAVAVGTGKGIEAGLALGIPVGMLGVQMDIIVRLINGIIVRKSEKMVAEGNAKSGQRLLLLCWILFGLEAAIAVLLSVTLGASFINQILDVTPEWVTQGLSLAGALLPVVGFSMLLKYMPVKKYINYALIGFVLSAYLQVPILGIAIVGFALAFDFYRRNNEASLVSLGEDEDE